MSVAVTGLMERHDFVDVELAVEQSGGPVISRTLSEAKLQFVVAADMRTTFAWQWYGNGYCRAQQMLVFQHAPTAQQHHT